MKKILLFFLLLIVGCNNSVTKTEELTVHDIDIDFPTETAIVMREHKTFNIIPGIYGYAIKDSIIFMFENNEQNIGHCYSLNSGKKLSTISNIGKANYEVTGVVETKNIILGDSIMIIDNNTNKMKVFSINDIISKPIDERNYSTREQLAVYESSARKIGNGLTLGIFGHHFFCNTEIYKRYFISDNDNNISYFGDVRKELFNIKKESDIKKMWITSIDIAQNKNKVIASYSNGVYLTVIDPIKKRITNERTYTKTEINTENGVNTSKSKYKSHSIFCNDQNIFCIVSKMNIEQTKKMGKSFGEMSILIFNWELNPIKKINLGEHLTRSSYKFFISEDGKSLYCLEADEENQKKRLMVGDITI